MNGDIALAGFMMTAEEWAALDAPSRALLLAIANKPDPVDEARPVRQAFAVGTAPITDEEVTR